jgi:hypothetical protein
VLKGNPKPLAEGKKKSVQFAGDDSHTKDDKNHPMGEECHTMGNKKNDKGSCGHTTTGGKQYQPKQQAPKTVNTTAATNSHPTHIPPVSHNDTHQSEQPLPEEEQKVIQTDLLHKKKKRRAKKNGTGQHHQPREENDNAINSASARNDGDTEMKAVDTSNQQ